MHSDAYFATGKTHTICEDYAYASSVEGWPYAIVSDGCSSSPDTDIGARLLARSLRGWEFKNDGLDAQRVADLLMTIAVNRARVASDSLFLDPDALDATLLYVGTGPNGCWISMSGDGFLVMKHLGSSDLSIYKMSHPHSAPNYLNYRLDPDRYSRYLDEYGDVTRLNAFEMIDGIVEGGEGLNILSRIYSTTADPKWGDVVAVFSDGISTFPGTDEIEIIESLMAFKNTRGNFVQRRMKRFLKDMRKAGIEPDDDVSMAAVCWE